MATLNDKLYAISGFDTTSIEFFDANNPVVGWQLYSQASFAVEREASSCAAIRTGTRFFAAGASAHDLICTDVSVPFTMTSFRYE